MLGLATGTTPVGVYDELVRLHREEGLSFANVITFNLDEYYPMQPNELQSYVRFMREHLFDLIDIPQGNWHVPDGTLPIEQVNEYCRGTRNRSPQAGGIDIQILGIGRTGHIGFNEPGSGKDSRTRLITLDRVTRIDAASDFFGEEHVPRRAITMGVGTILAARQIIMLAFGEHKAPIIAKAVEGEVSPTIAASFLQEHPNAQVVLDEAAADALTRYKSPWLLGPVEWDEHKVRKAVIWLARKLEKPILKLTDHDYNEDGLQDLLADAGRRTTSTSRCFGICKSTITGWPGGKPAHAKQPGDRTHSRDSIFPKRVIVFSPHPDDDVISMGGTLIRLADQGHEVHVAYQTSGNIAVFDDDAIRFADFVAEFNTHFDVSPKRAAELEAHVEAVSAPQEAGPGRQPRGADDQGHDPPRRSAGGRPQLRRAGRAAALPGHAVLRDRPREEEAARRGRHRDGRRAAAEDQAAPDLRGRRSVRSARHAPRVPERRADRLPSLREGRLVRRLRSLALSRRVAGVGPARNRNGRAAQSRTKSIASGPRSSSTSRRRTGRSFPGPDMREFWKRAEDRNRDTAQLYDKLGLAEYEAIEGFVRWRGDARSCGSEARGTDAACPSIRRVRTVGRHSGLPAACRHD